jgi:predicted DNA-binding transcriptional regulator AlpA
MGAQPFKNKLNITDLSAVFDVTRPTIYRHINAAKFRTMSHTGVGWLVDMSEVDEIIGTPGRTARLSVVHALLVAAQEHAFKEARYTDVHALLELAGLTADAVVRHDYTQAHMLRVHDFCANENGLQQVANLADNLLSSTLTWAVANHKRGKYL